MRALDVILGWSAFALVCLVTLAAPWFFGAWEMWWFWLFAACIFLATALFAVRLMLPGFPGLRRIRRPRAAAACALVYSAFLLYAAVRFLQAEVFMDAERSFLLFLTPFLLAGIIVTGFGRSQLRALSVLLVANLLALGLYGIINHLWTGSERVMWGHGYPGYLQEGRASGSYYCPDHFSGVMELLLCAALAILLSREPRWQWRALMILPLGVAVAGVVLSKSRGGGLTVAVVSLFILAIGFSQWPPRVGWTLRGGVLLLAAAGAVALAVAGGRYVERFRNYPWTRIEASDRYQMAMAALRAWKTNRVFGIGPGMHQNLWPHFAATEDGDREAGKWPTHTNHTFHSYEVHSDWTQLLEEYGIVGVVLFAGATGVGLGTLWAGRARALRRRKEEGAGTPHYWTLQAALFAAVALAFHSLGDFNLQMPATTWLLAALTAVPLAHVLREE